MKYFSNILATIIVALFLLSFGMKIEAVGQPCTSPFQHFVQNVTVDGCVYEVDLCVWCSPAFPGEVKVNFYRNLGPCSTTLTPDEITDQIFSQLATVATLWLDFCQPLIPPCKGNPAPPKKEVIFNIPICWKMIMLYKDDLDPKNNVYISVPCDDDAYCYTVHEYCKDKFGVIHHTIGAFLGYNFPPECTKEGYQIEKPDEVNEESECYILHTRCNP